MCLRERDGGRKELRPLIHDCVAAFSFTKEQRSCGLVSASLMAGLSKICPGAREGHISTLSDLREVMIGLVDGTSKTSTKWAFGFPKRQPFSLFIEFWVARWANYTRIAAVLWFWPQICYHNCPFFFVRFFPHLTIFFYVRSLKALSAPTVTFTIAFRRSTTQHSSGVLWKALKRWFCAFVVQKVTNSGLQIFNRCSLGHTDLNHNWVERSKTWQIITMRMTMRISWNVHCALMCWIWQNAPSNLALVVIKYEMVPCSMSHTSISQYLYQIGLHWRA